MGLVHATGQEIAVKQVSLPRDTADRNVLGQIRALEREVAVLQQFRHDNIVRYLGTERTAEHLNIFLEYVAGGSLSNKLSQFGALREETIRIYTKQILRGLEYLHQHQVVHRDIKGANILVDTNGMVKLADFGASKQLEDLTIMAGGLRSIHGTPHWMAPEVIRQEGHDCQADIWSLACVVIEMATGRPPWADVDKLFRTDVDKPFLAVLYHIATTQEMPPIPDTLSPQAKDFLALCLNREPSKRPSASQLLEHPWLHAVAVPRTVGAQQPARSAQPAQSRPPAKPQPAFSLHLRSIKEEPDTDSSLMSGATGGSSRTPPSGEAATAGTNLPSVNSLPAPPAAARPAAASSARPVKPAGPFPQRAPGRPLPSSLPVPGPAAAGDSACVLPAQRPSSGGQSQNQVPDALEVARSHGAGAAEAGTAPQSLTGNVYDSISCFNPLELISDSFMPSQDPAQLAFLRQLAAIPEDPAPAGANDDPLAAVPAGAPNSSGVAGGSSPSELAAPAAATQPVDCAPANAPPPAHAPSGNSTPLGGMPRKGTGRTPHGAKAVVVPSRPALAGIFAAAYEDSQVDAAAASAASAGPDGELSPRDQAPKPHPACQPAPRQRASASRRALEEAGILGGTLDLARAKEWRKELQAEWGGSLRAVARPTPPTEAGFGC